MKKILILILLLIVFITNTKAQAANLAWDQACDASSGCIGMTAAQALVAVQGYIYNAYLGTATVPTQLSPVTCTGTASPFICSTPTYAPFIGNTISLTAKNAIGESGKSVPLPLLLPAIPVNVRLR